MTQIWYAIRTEARREKEAVAGVRERGLDAFLPCETRLRRLKQGNRVVHNPLLPGYLFVGTNPDAKATVYECAKVAGVIDLVRRQSGEAAIIPAPFVLGLHASIAAGDFDYTPRRKALAVGGQARITTGPFSGLITTLISLPPNGRAQVLIGSGLFAGPASVDQKHLDPVVEEETKAA